MTIKVLITDGLASEGLKLLESSSLFAVDFHKAVEKAALAPLLADAVLARVWCKNNTI